MSQIPETPGEQLKVLLGSWADSLGQVLESMTDVKPEIRWESGITLAADPDTLWWEQSFHGAPEPLWVGTPQGTWQHAGTLTLKAAGLDTIEPTEARNTWLEILGQSLSAMSRSIGLISGREMRCEGGRENPPQSMPDQAAAISVKIGDAVLPPLWVAAGPKVLAALFSPPPVESAPQAVPAAAVHESREIAAVRAVPPPPPPTMELLLNVELPVSISFGKTQLPMKDVLKLTTGSIVELNRGVNESVEVMVNHCLIARGEVVVVEGNYGVRIQQIVSGAERMRSLR
jgi:flagellar motor switch protein FliN/FliY